MVFVTYPHSARQLRVKDENATVLHTTKRGAYLFTPVNISSLQKSFSRYCGIHIPYQTTSGWNMLKTIHSFLPLAQPSTVSILDNGAKLEYGQSRLHFSFDEKNILTLHTKGNLELPLVLDCREVYNFSTIGRKYTVTQDFNRTIIRYRKMDSDTEDSAVSQLQDSVKNFDLFVVVESEVSIKKEREWIETSYALEKKRNAGETKGYVFHPFTIHARDNTTVRIVSGFSKKECFDLLDSIEPVPDNVEIQTHHSTNQLALKQAKRSFSQLHISAADGGKVVPGLYAGVPWFFQFWSRDEAIGLIGLILDGKYNECKEILFRELGTLGETGLIVNRYPHSELPSADATGWMTKRFLDLLKIAPHVFTKKEITLLYTKIHQAISLQQKHHMRNGFMYSEPLETWMDTGRGYDERAGCRIEIQVLYLVQLELRKTLSFILSDSHYSTYESEQTVFSQNIHAAFLQNDVLCDGITTSGEPDTTIRPNIFLTYYLYPNLLTNVEWETVFDRALDALYQSWGGLSTIDKSNTLYCETHTGQTNESYHRGDSWYWVNNLAAICLSRVNAQKYNKFISQIKKASIEEILQHGALGCHAEISDSIELKSLGCYNQLWSNALFIELIEKQV